MDEIYGEENRLGLITIVHNPRGRSDDHYFATCHEYALAYGKNAGKTVTYKIGLTEEQAENFPLEDDESRYRLLPLKRTGSNSTPKERPNLFFPIYYNPKNNEISLEEKEGFVSITPLDMDGNKRVWRWGKQAVLERKDTEIVIKKSRDGNFSIFAKDRIKEGRKPKTVWMDPKYDASSHGTMLLQKILGKRKTFDYPKSLYAVKDLLEIGLKGKKNAIILDFFAGSGTTGHATLELNNEDGGQRNFILCTNNESGISEDVCHPRIEKVIKGYSYSRKNIQGLGGNLKYFKTSFVPAEPTDKNKIALTEKITEMLCIKENTFEEVKSEKRYKIFRNVKSYTGIVFDHQVIDDFKKEIAKINGKFSLYIFSLGDDTFEEEFEDMKKKVKLSPIPEAILRVYRRIFK
jgi:adenine-specific DNA-methyltransferase